MNRLPLGWRHFLGLLVAVTVFGASYGTTTWIQAYRSQAADDLSWLNREFQLTDGELARIRVVHEGYRPLCRAMCDRIAEKNRELKSMVAGATNVCPGIEQKLTEVAVLRVECQAHGSTTNSRVHPRSKRRD